MSEHVCYVKMVGVIIFCFQAEVYTIHGIQCPQGHHAIGLAVFVPLP